MKRLLQALGVVALATAALPAGAIAADMPDYPVIETPEPAPLPAVGAWYLRGDIGYKFYNNPSSRLDDPTAGSVTPNVFTDEDLDDTYNVGVGVGYKFNQYFRTDFTLDYEGPAEYYGRSPCTPCAATYSEESFNVSAWSGLVNAYVDLGTYAGITPYVGGGIGASYLRTGSGSSSIPAGASYSGDDSWNFAWALMAGASYAVNPNWSVDIGYRYINLGDAKTGLVGTTPDTYIRVDNIDAHEVRVGLRYTFN